MKPFEQYEPFGEEWEKEMMKLPKKVIIGMYAGVAQAKIKLEDKLTPTAINGNKN